MSWSKDDQQMHSVTVDDTGQRIAGILRGEYPRNREKLIARDFDVSPRTARGWLSGRLPQNKHLLMMAARWKEKFLAVVFGPLVGDEWAEELELRAELRELDARLARLRKRVGQRP